MPADDRSDLPDLRPAAEQLARLLGGISDDQLAARTPCENYTLGDIVEHVGGLALAFTWAAEKEWPDMPSQAPSGDVARLDADWRTRIPGRLSVLGEAWRNPEAWQGMTRAGGVSLPGEIAGVVALDELVVHGWDLARASGQPFDADPAHLAALHGFVSAAAAEAEAGEASGGLFGPPVQVPEDAPLLDRVIGLTGRDPAWSA